MLLAQLVMYDQRLVHYVPKLFGHICRDICDVDYFSKCLSLIHTLYDVYYIVEPACNGHLLVMLLIESGCFRCICVQDLIKEILGGL